MTRRVGSDDRLPGMTDSLQSLLALWAHLRAAHHVYWTMHWRSRGPTFYADHQLFGDLYEARVSEIDDLAEYIATAYGPEALNPLKAWTDAAPIIKGMVESQDMTYPAACVLAAVEAANKALASCQYPASAQNLVSGIGTAHLKALYLLQRRFAK